MVGSLVCGTRQLMGKHVVPGSKQDVPLCYSWGIRNCISSWNENDPQDLLLVVGIEGQDERLSVTTVVR